MHNEFKVGRTVRIRQLDNEALDEKYSDVNHNKGKTGKIKRIITSRTGTTPSDAVEPTTQDKEFDIDLGDGNIITAPHEALELL